MKITLLTINYGDKEVREFRCQHKSSSLISAKYPLNMLELASYLESEFNKKENELAIEIIDGNVSKINKKDLIDQDYLIFFSSQNTLKKDLIWINNLKKNYLITAKIILVGLDADYYRQDIEKIYPQLIDFIPKSPFLLSVLFYLKNKNNINKYQKHFLKKPRKELIKEELLLFKKTKFDFSKINLNKYYIKVGFYKKKFGEIVVGKGCYNRCNFCVVPYLYQNQVVKRDISQIISEIKFFVSNNIKYIHFFDEDFLNDTDFVQKLLKEIIKQKFNIKFSISAKISEINNEKILKLLKKAGCISVSIGVESASQDVLKRMDKIRDTSYDFKNISLCDKYFYVHGHIILGYEKNKSELKKTIDFILKSDLSILGIYSLTPFPYSKIFEKIQNKPSFNDIDSFNYDAKNSLDCLYNLNKIKRKLYFRFYGFKRIVKLIRKIPCLI